MASDITQAEGVVHVTEKGQATIPSALRKRFGISAPGRVRFVAKGGRLVVEPVPSVTEMMGSLRARLPSGVSLVADLRAERKRDFAREEGKRRRRR